MQDNEIKLAQSLASWRVTIITRPLTEIYTAAGCRGITVTRQEASDYSEGI